MLSETSAQPDPVATLPEGDELHLQNMAGDSRSPYVSIPNLEFFHIEFEEK